MPGGDRTGPIGQGPMTGRRLGICAQRQSTGRKVSLKKNNEYMEEQNLKQKPTLKKGIGRNFTKTA